MTVGIELVGDLGFLLLICAGVGALAYIFKQPMVLGFLVALAFRALPAQHRLKGPYAWVVVGVALLTAGLGVYGGITGASLF